METNEGSDVMYCHGVENIRLEKRPNGGYSLSPYLIIEIGDDEDDGVEDIAQVYSLLKGKLKVPFFVTSQRATIFSSLEV